LGSQANVSAESLSGDLIDRLDDLADRFPDHVVYIELLDGKNESARLTARQLRDQAVAVAASLTDRGIKRDDVVLLIATPPLEFLVGLFGCMWAGVIAAPIAFPRRPEHVVSRLEPVRANAGAVGIVAATPQGEAEEGILGVLTGGELPVIAVTAEAPEAPTPPVRDREIAYLQYTSGSTSDPRGVIVTHDNLTANLDVCHALLDIGVGSVNVSWCPLTHDMGLIMGALPSIAFGMVSVLMPPAAFIRRPMTWMRAIDRYRGTHAYSPNFGYDLCVERSTPEERSELDLSSVKCLINGAEPVRRRTRDRFLEAFEPCGLPVASQTAGYGLAESSVLVTATQPDRPFSVVWVDAKALEQHDVVLRDEDDEGVRELCSDGVFGPGYEARIVHPVTLEVLPPERVGELCLRGPSVCPGYWNRDEETRATFGVTIPGDDGGPYLRTGDLAFLHEGELVMCGRSKDLIIMRGRNLYPQDIELAAELSHEAVRDGGSAAFTLDGDMGETLGVVVEVDGEPDATDVANAVKEAVLREFEVHVADVMLVAPYKLPKTSSGKKQRSATRRLWSEAREQREELAPRQ
jgi:acyl-CoA synthetase (AMP-forming)/AMP-acid ligase II